VSASLTFFGPLAEHRFAIAQRLLDEDLEILAVPGEKGMFIVPNGTAEHAKRRENRDLLFPFEYAGEIFSVVFA
jgi:hypothetical protein